MPDSSGAPPGFRSDSSGAPPGFRSDSSGAPPGFRSDSSGAPPGTPPGFRSNAPGASTTAPAASPGATPDFQPAPHPFHWTQPIANALQTTEKAATLHGAPGALDAILGAPQRLVGGTAVGVAGEHGGPHQDRGLFTGIYDATHPFDDTAQQRLTDDLGGLPILKQVSDAAGGIGYGIGSIGDFASHIINLVGEGADYVTGHPTTIPATQHAQFLQKFAKTLAVQSLTDPLTIVPVLGELDKVLLAKRGMNGIRAGAEAAGLAKGAAAARRLARIDDLHKAWQTSTMRKSMDWAFQPRNELYQAGLDDIGASGRMSIEGKYRGRSEQQAVADNHFLKQHTSTLANSQRDASGNFILPDAVKQRLWAEPWAFGTAETRQEALNLGFNPEKAVRVGALDPDTARRFAAAPAGWLKYQGPLQDNYVTLIRPRTWSDEDSALFKQYGGLHKDSKATFERQRSATAPTKQIEAGDLPDIIANRLSLGRQWVFRRAVDQETSQFLQKAGGLSTKPGLPLSADEAEGIVSKLSHGPAKYWSKVPLAQLARTAGKASVMWNPIPHGFKNIGEAAYLATGPQSVGRFMAYMAKGLQDTQLSRLRDMGQDVNWSGSFHGPFESLLNTVGAPSQVTLTRMERAWRQAVLDHLDATMGEPSGAFDALEAAKAQKMRDAMFDYHNTSRFAAAVQALGGPFAAFRVQAVPRAVGGALRDAGGRARVTGIARAETDVNRQRHEEGQNAIYNPADPIQNFSEMVNPATMMKYFSSASTAGIPGYALQLLARLAYGQPLNSQIQQAPEYFVPGYRPLEGAANDTPLHQSMQQAGMGWRDTPGAPTDPASKLLETLMGQYYSQAPSPTALRRLRRIAK